MQDTETVADTVPATQPDAPRLMRIQFTGSGSEYFRIWAVNLLLSLVTLGLYLPFAKARRIRYFYANTLVDGQALGFHGDPWKMFRGFLLLVVLMGVYAAAGHFSPIAAVVAFIILCAVWPALWRASMQFRLANTSWRGLRMGFDGSLKDVYLACAPLYLPTIVFVAWSRMMEVSGSTDSPESREAMARFGIVGLIAMLAMLLLTPLAMALFKRYQHNGYRLAGQHARLTLSTGSVYLLGLKTVGVWFGSLFAGILAAAMLGGAAVVSMGGRPDMQSPLVMAAFFAVGLLVYLLMFAIVMPYAAARMQNLVWNGTRSEALQFSSRLAFGKLFPLTLLNWLLTALTLGLYRPFAAVATAKLRLEAVSIESREDPADWLAASTAGHADATGELAGDFFGIDIGL